ncbi:2-keto-4-pentenoate hydratase [Pseudonocardia oroxyli]|uniref:2-keto-4-pentenoate hydratase n=1 Tax=Pseudonocardia oroxyli TaxID=366584 RepID=A0A1G7RH18_PSEOR|nr:fumarylacetoacetate hydrolase family protein [Pseudonocardia oroxyli]SDG09350.1 2-keto-4-pentenoate hydratase [Pseudonocardia oroxyli]
MPLTAETLADRAADLLWTAWTTGEVLDGLPEDLHPHDHEAGWAIQRRVVERAGASYGWKIAATSAPSQAVIGIGTPLPGRLFEGGRVASGDRIPFAGLHMRAVEAEYAFRLARDIGPEPTREEVLAAVGGMHLAIEVPDSRLADYAHAGSSLLLADVACAGHLVLGPELSAVPDDLATIGTALWINGERTAEGDGAVVMGDPRTALVWLAEELVHLGTGLKAGEIVTTGSTTKVPSIQAGDHVRADFGPLGQVDVTFT